MEYDDEDLIDEDFIEDFPEKNYVMVRRLIVEAKSDYTNEKGLTELDYYLENLERADPLKSFIDDEGEGLLEAAFYLFIDDNTKVKIDAILHYIVNHNNFKLREDNIVFGSQKSDYLFFKIIQLGGNVHHIYKSDCSVLHAARSINIVKYVLQEGVDVNFRNNEGCTRLHYACMENSLDIIELLLQNELLDLYLPGRWSKTPIELAIFHGHFDAASLILNSKLADNLTFGLLYDLFCCLCKFGTENSDPTFTLQLIVIIKPRKNASPNVFELLWKKLVESYILLSNTTKEPPVLSTYLNNSSFVSKIWSNSLKIILTSEIAHQLLEECITYEKKNIFTLLIPKLIEAGVEREDRIQVLELILSMGFTPNLQDMADTLFYLKFNEEFQLLSQYLPDDCLVNGVINGLRHDEGNLMLYLAIIFCGLEDNLDYKKIFSEELPPSCYDFVMQYFSPALSNCCFKPNYDDDDGFVSIPKILSLKEVSRNSVRKFIKNKNEVRSPKCFISAVLSLKTSYKIKNFIMLKASLNEL